jgi:subtilisin family serine protease
VFGRKHVSPGRVGKPQIFASREQQMLALTHDCTTFSGTLGGPVIDVASGKVIGVQVEGRRFGPGFAIPARELARDGRIVRTGIQLDRAASPSENAWKDFWEKAEPQDFAPADKPPRPRALRRRRVSIDDVRARCASILPDTVKLQDFLKANEFEAVAAVPQSLSNADYREGVLRGLDRRGWLDDFDRALWRVSGAAPADEPAADANVIAEDANALLPSPADAQRAMRGARAEGPRPTETTLPANVVADLLAAVNGSDEDMASFIAVGSQWRDWLVGPDAKAQTLTETIKRLAGDAAPDARQALTWLVGKLVHMAQPPDTEQFNALTRAYAYLASSEERVPAALAPILPADYDFTDVGYLARGSEACKAVVTVQGPAKKGDASFYGGSGWLLTPDLVVVPAHLIQGPNDVKDENAAAERVKSFEARFDFDTPESEGVKVPVQKLELFDDKLDLAIVRLAREVADRAPLHVNPDPPPPGPGFLTMIHHPRLGPKKISIRGGRLIGSDAHQVTYMIATQPGSAGAPVLDMEWCVIATHRAYQAYRPSPDAKPLRAKLGTATTALLSALREGPPEKRYLWREVVAAQPALKVIDGTLYAKLREFAEHDADAVVPMVIEVSGPSVTLAEVPGLQIGMRDSYLITAMGTKASLDALVQSPGVLTVRGSTQSGSVECAVSIPHIGATKIHEELHERGEMALIALIDNGLDVLHESFRDENGKTRVVAFWDQKDSRAPAGNNAARQAQSMSAAGRAMVDSFGLTYGALYAAADLQGFIDGTLLVPETFPKTQLMAHGTTVASIAAGRRTGEARDMHFPGGIAPAALLIVVRYDLQESSVGYSMGHIDALAFIDKLATKEGKPVVVNISNGMNAGAHDGTSPVEQKCQEFTANGQAKGRVIVKSAGNERGKGRHAMLKVGNGSIAELRWRSAAVMAGGKSVPEIIELWFPNRNQYRFRVKPPTGGYAPAIFQDRTAKELHELLENSNQIDAVLRMFNPENGDGSLHLELSRGNAAEVEGGEWLLEISGVNVQERQPIHGWVEETLNRDLFFLDHVDDEVTITIPGTAKDVMTVGAIDIAASSQMMKPYGNSSSGPSRKGQEKPEVVAPGVGVRGALFGSGRGVDEPTNGKSGTSVAAPHVTGAIALALSAQAKRANEEQFNSNQIKAALQRSLRHLSVWNETTGYGELDARELLRLLEEV